MLCQVEASKPLKAIKLIPHIITAIATAIFFVFVRGFWHFSSLQGVHFSGKVGRKGRMELTLAPFKS